MNQETKILQMEIVLRSFNDQLIIARQIIENLEKKNKKIQKELDIANRIIYNAQKRMLNLFVLNEYDT